MSEVEDFLHRRHFVVDMTYAAPTLNGVDHDEDGLAIITVDRKCLQQTAGLSRLIQLHQRIGTHGLYQQIDGTVTWSTCGDPGNEGGLLVGCDWRISKPFGVHLRLAMRARDHLEQWTSIAPTIAIGLISQDTADDLAARPPEHFAGLAERCVVMSTGDPDLTLRQLAASFDTAPNERRVDIPAELAAAFGAAEIIAEINRRLLPETICASCWEPIGAGWVSVATQPHPDDRDGWYITLNHRRCRAPQHVTIGHHPSRVLLTSSSITRAGSVTTRTHMRPAQRRQRWWRRYEAPEPTPLAVIALNPSVDVLELKPDPLGGVMTDLTIDSLREAGWEPAETASIDIPDSPLHARRSAAGQLDLVNMASGHAWRIDIPNDPEFWAVAEADAGMLIIATHSVILNGHTVHTADDLFTAPGAVGMWATLLQTAHPPAMTSAATSRSDHHRGP